MLFLYLHKDIVKYVLNLYINLKNDAAKIENIICKYSKINFRFYIKPHFIYRIVMNKYTKGLIWTKQTMIDNIYIKTEYFYENGIRENIYYHINDMILHSIIFNHCWGYSHPVTGEENEVVISYNRQREI